jgi:hypothetical protein
MDVLPERTDSASFRERFGDLVCGFQTQVFYLFVIQIVLLVLMLVSLLSLDPGSASYAVLQLDFILMAITLTPTLLILYLCSRREEW